MDRRGHLSTACVQCHFGKIGCMDTAKGKVVEQSDRAMWLRLGKWYFGLINFALTCFW